MLVFDNFICCVIIYHNTDAITAVLTPDDFLCVTSNHEAEFNLCQDNEAPYLSSKHNEYIIFISRLHCWVFYFVPILKRKGRELADMMERRKVDILCVQETRWKGSKARSIGAGFKLFYYGVDSKRNGVGVVLKEEFVRNVLEVKRVSDRVMGLKLEIEGVMLNVVSGYAPQVGCELEEKERFWSELDEVMESIPTGERVVIGVDFNGHVG
ncbi:hypothetical protein QTP86_007727 [Hemibagrus guttatus]|nr:hypothetical protein QTP86_007727 [Hemibagrus guttatus]